MQEMEKRGVSPLTLNPEQDLFQKESVPQREKVTMLSAQKKYQAGSIEESMLTEEEKKMVDQFSEAINIADSRQVFSYGAAAQRNISDFSVMVLNKVKTRDLGDIGNVLRDLTVSLNESVEPEKKGFAGLFRKAKRNIDSIKANYAQAETNVMQIEKDLEAHQVVLMQDVAMFDQMYELNMKYYKELTMYIIAGEKALDKARGETLEIYRMQAERTQLPEDVQHYNDYLGLCSRFEKKLHDLKLTRTVALQSAPQIRMIQSNDEEMLEKIQSSIINTIPLWRNQIVLSLGIEHSRRAVAAQNAVTETTNNLLQMNAALLKQATVDTAKESEKSIVDIETLKKCNQELIFSINEVVKIHEQGAKQRQQAQEELLKIEMDLKQALLNAGSRK